MANGDGPNSFWPGFGDDNGTPEVYCDYNGSLAYKVLNDYDIYCSSSVGGSLPDLDIKHMDAMQVIKLSLLEESATTGAIYEPIMDSLGRVNFKRIGTGGGVSDIYYEVHTGSYREDCSGVMIVGKNPMAYRRPIEWKPIWQGGDHEIYDTGFMYNSCVAGDFNQYCTIVYDDPHLNSAYEDGIDNLYDITNKNPYDTIVGYAQYIAWEGWQTDRDTVVERSDTAKILVELPLTDGLGKLQRRPTADPSLSENPACFEGLSGSAVNFADGVKVPLPDHFRFESVRGTTVDKFSGITGVYIVGRVIDDLRGEPKSPADGTIENPTKDNMDVWVTINKNYDEVVSLERGRHFQVAYTEDPQKPEPYIVFADNSRVTDPIEMPEGEKVTFFINPYCEYAINPSGGVVESETGYILPTSPTGGVLIRQIFVAVELNTPSIVVYNPDGWRQKARQIAESLEYMVAPLVSVDEPAPIGFNGSIINQTIGRQDHDPTTAQNFSLTPLEDAMDQMDAGGGMSLTLSFLNESQVRTLSGALYNYLGSRSGTEATYICGPNCYPELGGVAPNGGIVNSIVYSYQDSNSYTVSVNAGPTLVGGNLAQVDGGPALKITEEVSAKGTVIQDSGNNIYFKVHVDGIGDRIAVNMCPAVIRSGDKVTVAIHNNPVEA